MPRRVAATGFGGNAGLGILAGVARGNLERQAREEEAKSEAINRRLKQSRIRSSNVRTGLAQDEAKRRAQEAEDEKAAGAAFIQAARPILRKRFPELDEEEIASLPVGAVERLIGLQQDIANQEQVRSATAVNQLRGQQARQALRDRREGREALNLLANPTFVEIASLDLDPATKIATLEGALQGPQGVPGASPERIRTALDELNRMNEEAVKLAQRRQEAAGDTGDASVSGDLVRSAVEARIEQFGSAESALNETRKVFESLPADHPQRVLLERTVAELERISGADS